ncbi:FAD-dependent oxidoreductase [Mycolicibacterium holsaticum]|uniref:Amine oxidase n=1 Tax=Mycolicibacterium holsaticum TaxID=152142 RepID=A0A1E3R9V4_9MYCO|nr:FAD-dependent oxidoreductase [Mycolicibacterium holsaticum]ODQ86643.1 amine oxidase [Mycolicibacterium holsaticum]
MTRTKERIAILGGGMAGLTAAWRLSEPGWRDRFESITVYQRGWRLGGKGASSRGEHGRIEEHGLHVWIGSYENAFTLIRQCYVELDRAGTDPSAPIQTWDQAFIPANDVGATDRWQGEWRLWLGRFTGNEELPGEPSETGAAAAEMTVTQFVERALQLILDFADSLRTMGEAGLTMSVTAEIPAPERTLDAVQRAVLAALIALADPQPVNGAAAGVLAHALDAIRDTLDVERRADHRLSWTLLSLLTATVRGVLADGLVTDPRGLRSVNDEDYGAWVLRHGAHPEVLEFPVLRAMYNMVFGYEKGHLERPTVSAGVGMLLVGLMFFTYKGAIFWKMTAGMGDIVMAPLYEVLRRRGVEFEFFHRVDALHLDRGRQYVDAITMGRQVWLADESAHYEPLTRVRGLPVFPNWPLTEQLETRDGLGDLESHFGSRDDAETRVLRRGVDFDRVVLAVSLGMVEVVAQELIADRPEWQEMTTHLRTIATQGLQIWLRPDHAELGLAAPAITTSGYIPPIDTFSSMPQTLWAEEWPADDQPQTVAYFCGALDVDWSPTIDQDAYARRCRQIAEAETLNFLDNLVGVHLPGAVRDDGFAWHLVAGAQGRRGAEALATQHVSVNIDPSDRYVLSLPGTDDYRLRPDEAGYDNLVLAGDWTDSGLNSGCIESAVLSGLQAANTVLGHGRFHRIRGLYLP